MRALNSTPKRSLAGVAALALLALPLSACGSSDNSAKPSSDSSSAPAPKPVAAIDTLTGGMTEIKLDQSFLDALGTLGLTPGVLGKAGLNGDTLSFPITGGNVTYFKPGTVSPFVIGQIQHIGSGLSLTAGDVNVKLSNFNVDPGVSRVYGDVVVNDKTAIQSAYLFTLDGRTLEPLKSEGSNAILTGTKVEISPVAAGLLNDTFGTDAVTDFFPVGVATITVATGG